MSYADPLSITIGAATYSLPRTSVGDNKSVYTATDVDNKITLTASHQYGKRTRRVLRLDHLTFHQADSYLPSNYADVGGSIYTVFDFPSNHVLYGAASVKAIWDGYDALLNASSDVLVTKLLGGES